MTILRDDFRDGLLRRVDEMSNRRFDLFPKFVKARKTIEKEFNDWCKDACIRAASEVDGTAKVLDSYPMGDQEGITTVVLIENDEGVRSTIRFKWYLFYFGNKTPEEVEVEVDGKKIGSFDDQIKLAAAISKEL